DNLYGGEGNDTFQVSEGQGDDDFDGGEGDDTIVSMDGSDIRIDSNLTKDNSVETISSGGNEGVNIVGDGSSQTLDFSETKLDGIQSIDGGAGNDNITGSTGDDTIIAGEGNDNLYGGEGNDTFQVSEGQGYDDFDGGEGDDTIVSMDGSDIRIDSHLTSENSIETISSGGNEGVNIVGDGSSQTLDFSETKLDGIESIDAGSGNDTVTGSASNDTVDGGQGTDTYVLEGTRSEYHVTQNEDGSYTVKDLVEGRGGEDTVSNFENFRFSDGSFNSTTVLEDDPYLDTEIEDQSTNEDSPFSLDVSGNFGEVDGDTLTYSATLGNGDPLPDWVSIDSDTGIISGAPGNGDVGGISIIVTVSDGQSTASDNFSLTVENTNDGPTVSVSIDDVSTDEDAAFKLDVSSNFKDEDLGDTLTYSATLENGTQLPDWITIDSDTGELSGTPENGDVGDLSITVTASDGEESASDTFTVTVENTNDGPVANADSSAVTERNTVEIDVLANDTDVDVGDSLTITDANVPSGQGSVTIVDNKLIYDPEGGFSDLALDDTRNVEISYTISDGNGGTSTATATVTVTGDDSLVYLGNSANTYTSSDYDSEIHGESGNDTIYAEGGNDTLIGGSGNDTLYGGEGNDTFEYADGDGTDDFFGGEGNDTIKATEDDTEITINNDFGTENSIENITSNGNENVTLSGDNSSQSLDFSETNLDGIDSITGGAGNDTLIGNDQDNTFQYNEGDGSDDYYGGEGNDTLKAGGDDTEITLNKDFGTENSIENITADGNENITLSGDNSSQTLDFSETNLNGIDSITGGAGSDTLIGNNQNNTFQYNEGDGSDDYYGGEGDDTLKAGSDDTQITLNKDFGAENSIENITADGNENVTLSGDNSSQTLDFSQTNLEGIGSISGGAGNDSITGSSSNDSVDGGEGKDTYHLEGNRSDYQITQNEDGSYRIEDTVENRGGIDTVENFENFEFADITLEASDILNTSPVIESEISDLSTNEDSLFSLDISNNFKDIEGDTLTYSATLENGGDLPDWITINSETGELSGTPENGDVGDISITVTASDG
ncbi:putative Ig domain-containing protein, partial [Puniceicoccaceae bacterium K14]|nr:putative Ig domain-containing protein [Puniceicoccaceae bacterium K14]